MLVSLAAHSRDPRISAQNVLLDKVCIDQENETRKSAGIANLGAFLGSSSNFVVLFSPEYFTSVVLLRARSFSTPTRQQTKDYVPSFGLSESSLRVGMFYDSLESSPRATATLRTFTWY